MQISKIQIKNFRLLQDATLDVKKGLSLLIGKNNSGKTSLIVAFQKFFQDSKFTLDDFPLCQRQKILNITEATKDSDLAIQMIVEIKYDEVDDLSYLSEFILDLDPLIKTVNLLFECGVDKPRLLKSVSGKADPDKERYISKHITEYTRNKLYVFQNESDLDWVDRSNLVEKSLNALKDVINLQIIHAKRNVSSSEESARDKQALSYLTTKFYNDNEKSSEGLFSPINQKMIDMDIELDTQYANVFDGFLKNAKDFLNLKNLKVISNLKSQELISHSSQVVYGGDGHVLPEHLNGLGFMNILYLLLDIEIKKYNIENENKSINLLFIEEPEAHTHPQMQYVFAREIKKIKETINLQTLITTHSSHIVSQCNFEDVRYLTEVNGANVKIKNFHDELKVAYTDSDHFKFLVQYLTLESSELFFADKIIFIEGTTEKILLPYFISLFDKALPEGSIRLSSQNISMIEVGANARVFAPFLEFLGIKTLIITDIDTTKKITEIKDGETTIIYPAHPVSDSDHTSNYTLKHFYSAPEISKPEFSGWFNQLKSNELFKEGENIKVAYQIEDQGYHARSFEDAFLHINREKIKLIADKLEGLQNVKLLNDDTLDTYQLNSKILKNKSAFASSLLYQALTRDDIEFDMPLYIQEALAWLQK
ncbi:MAG: ATP-dependent endonuclease [Methylotenera sp.]|nr:ATP-dependent endonuclease [Methylotenera sp.]